MALQFERGNPSLLGATPVADGINFAVYSKSATSVVIDFFKKATDKEPFYSHTFDADSQKLGSVWSVLVKGLPKNVLYLYRVSGPNDAQEGQRFNPNKYLLDPYSKAFTQGSVFLSYNKLISDGLATIQNGKLLDLSNFPKCVVINDDEFDWAGDKPLNLPLSKCVIYETHLKGYTASPTSSVKFPGTYKGFIEKIPYLKSLGVTTVELLPIFEFDDNENSNINPKTGEKLKNYWGYSTIGFFAPKTSYATMQSLKTPGGAVSEFKTLVREMHKNGLEVVLDVVFNHTAEGNEHGYTFSFRGFENSVYYMLPKEKQYYMNFSGCGNTFNTSHPVVTKFVLDCLRYWVSVMHVDGFRFDLATSLLRNESGDLRMDSFLAEAISEDPILAKTKIIAEPWDCGGGYLVGGFPGGRWSEWNDRFRNDIRRFIRGDESVITAAATRIAGSSDLYNHDNRRTTASINFITAHDGFTLNDLVSFNGKHNAENGEDNRDGTNDNNCYNNGFEGITINPKIESIRLRKLKNAMLCLMVSQGVPMILGGDEFRRTQEGNNNAYCQDNEISWINWNLQKKNTELTHFTQVLIALRKAHHVFRREHFFSTQIPQIDWFDFNGKSLEWNKIKRFLGFMLYGDRCVDDDGNNDNDFYVAGNTDIYDITITLPTLPGGKFWHIVCDTSIEGEKCAFDAGSEELLREQRRYILPAGCFVILMSK